MERWKDNLAALIPCYDPGGGNATLIYTISGELERDRRTVRWILRRLARACCVDLDAARLRFGEYLACNQGVPLPFTDALVLVPLKVRRPVGRNDGSWGYFNPAAVEDVVVGSDGSAGSVLLLHGGHLVGCLYTLKTVKKRLQAGSIVLDRFSREKSAIGALAAGPDVLPPGQRRFLEQFITILMRGRDC